VQFRHEQVVIETPRHRIVGTLTLPQEGYRSRMSDFLNSTERDFIALTDAVVTQLDDVEAQSEQELVVVSRRHIVLAIPAPGAA